MRRAADPEKFSRDGALVAEFLAGTQLDSRSIPEPSESVRYMVAVSPFFATTRLLNEIRSVRTRTEGQHEHTAKSASREESVPAKPRRKPK